MLLLEQEMLQDQAWQRRSEPGSQQDICGDSPHYHRCHHHSNPVPEKGGLATALALLRMVSWLVGRRTKIGEGN